MAKEQENDIDSLARMVADGFSSMQKQMNERFDEVDNRLDKVDSRLDIIEKDVREVHARIDEVVIPAIDDHARRIKDLEVRIA